MISRTTATLMFLALAPGVSLAQTNAPAMPLGQLQPAFLTPSAASPQAAAIGDELYSYLSQAAGGETKLFRMLTGADRQVNQVVSLLLDDSVITPGNLTYTGAQLDVVSKVTTVSACGNVAQSIQDTQSGTYVTQASWTAAQSQTSTRSRTVSVTASVSEFGASLSSTYSFTNTNSNTNSNEKGQTQSQTTQWSTEQTVTAQPNTATVFRRDLLTLSAGPTGTQYTLKPTVAANANLNLVVQTNGINAYQLAQQLFGSGGQSMSAFFNLPALGQTYPASDALFPSGGILWSPDGRYAFGREIQGKKGDKYYGAYSLIDLGRTPNAAAPWRLWSTNCAALSSLARFSPFMTFSLSAAGDAVWRCADNKVQTHLGTSQSTRACRFLTFTGNNGQLVCYDRDVTNMTPDQSIAYVAGYPGGKMRAVAAQAAQSQTTFVQYSVPLAEVQNALRLPVGPVQLTLTGTFSGSHPVSLSWCATSLPLVQNPHTGYCGFQKGGKPLDNAVCPETSAKLMQFHRSRPDAITVLSTDGSDVANQQ